MASVTAGGDDPALTAPIQFLTEEVTTLVVRHLPPQPAERIEQLLAHFGAQQVRVMESRAMVSIT